MRLLSLCIIYSLTIRTSRSHEGPKSLGVYARPDRDPLLDFPDDPLPSRGLVEPLGVILYEELQASYPPQGLVLHRGSYGVVSQLQHHLQVVIGCHGEVADGPVWKDYAIHVESVQDLFGCQVSPVEGIFPSTVPRHRVVASLFGW